ncbi:hypothetical protein GGR58DRAFT_459301 [Xylaria digitata]|nr:hypothetical protein GGR58DRAFT_459301 [Xylaria digitata]
MMSLEDHQAALAASLVKANLVPGSAAGLISEGFRPTTKLDVSFGRKGVELGTFFRSGECKQAPKIAFAAEADAPENTTYSFILTDPGERSSESFSSYFDDFGSIKGPLWAESVPRKLFAVLECSHITLKKTAITNFECL